MTKKKHERPMQQVHYVESTKTGLIIEASNIKSEIKKAFDSISDGFIWVKITGNKNIIAKKVEGERTYTMEGAGI